MKGYSDRLADEEGSRSFAGAHLAAMASSTAYRAQLNHLRQGYLSRNDLRGKVASPPAVAAVEDLIDLTSYEEEYDYLVARRRAVSSTTPTTSPKKADDAVSRIREEAKTPRRNQTGQSRDDDDYERIARMLSLSQSESNPRPLNLNLEEKMSDQSEAAGQIRTTPRALAKASPRALSSASSPSRNFPSSLSLQIRDEVEEVKKVTATSSADDDSGGKDSIIRLEDILGRDRRVDSPDPIPTTPSLEADYHASGKRRKDKLERNDPDKLRVLTPEPIPASPSLETELTLRRRRSASARDACARPAAVESILETKESAETSKSAAHPQPSLKKSSYGMPPGGSDGVIAMGDGKQIDDAKHTVSKNVSFRGEAKPIISVVDTEDKDIYGDIEIRGGSGIDSGGGSGCLWSPSYESDPMLGSKSMYRRAIMARRRKSAARTATDGGGGGFSGAASSSRPGSNGGAFKPIVSDSEELEEVDITSPSVRGNVRADKYRSLAISPVKSSMDQDDSFWILSPSPQRSPQGGEMGDDDDTREEEDGERSSLEGDKRENEGAPLLPVGNGALFSTKSMSPTVERRMRSTKSEFDYNDIRSAKSLSFRQNRSNGSQSRTSNSTRNPPIIDVESNVSGSDFEVTCIPSNGTTHSSPRSTSPRRHQASPQLSERTTPLRRLHMRSSIPISPLNDQRSPESRDDGGSLVRDACRSSPGPDVLNLVSDIPGIPAAKSEPGGWRARCEGMTSLDELEIPKVMTEPRNSSASKAVDAKFVNSLPRRSREGARSTDLQGSVPSKFVSEFLDEPIIAPDLPVLTVDNTDVVSTRSRSPQRARVTPETPNRPARSLVQQRLSAEMRKVEETLGPLVQNHDSPHQCIHPVIDAEDFSIVVNGGGGEIQAIDSVNKLVNTFDDDDGATDVAFEAPIPKPYSKDLAISESESSTSQLESDANKETAEAAEDESKGKTVAFRALQPPNDRKGTRVDNESECENTSGDDSYAVGQRKYRKYSSDENGGQTSGNETDSKLSIINSESSESELGVDPDLDPHVLYDSEAMRFVVQILDRSCAWLEDDGCSCNFQGQPSSLLREIKKKSRAGPIPSGGLETSQVPTPRASNSKKSRVSGKASSLVRMVAKQNPGGPLVQKLQNDKERRSQRSSLPPPEGEVRDVVSHSKVSVFARPRRRQTSPRRIALPDSDTGSSDDPEAVQRSPPRSPPRRRRSQSPRKRSFVKEETKLASPIPSDSAPMKVIEERGVIQVLEPAEPGPQTDSDSAISPFQKKLQERLASVRGQSQSDSSVGPEAPEASSPVSQSIVREEARGENSEAADVPGRSNRSPSPVRRPTPLPQNQAPPGTFNARSSPPVVDARPLVVSNLRSIAADSSEADRNGFRSAPPGGVSGRHSVGSPEKSRVASQPKSDAPGIRRRVESIVVAEPSNPSGSREAARVLKDSRGQRTRSRKATHGEPRSRKAKASSAASLEAPVSREKGPYVPAGPSSASSVNSGSGGPEQRRRVDHPPPRGGVMCAPSLASTSQLSSASFVSRGPDSRLETIHEQLTPLSSAASSPSASLIFGRSSPFHGLTEAERLAALELAEKLRRRAANLKRRRREREQRMNQFLTDEEDEDPASN